jgi:hypothetical protein
MKIEAVHYVQPYYIKRGRMFLMKNGQWSRYEEQAMIVTGGHPARTIARRMDARVVLRRGKYV